MSKIGIQTWIDKIMEHLRNQSFVELRKFYIGKNSNFEAAIIYFYHMADKQLIERDILNPLMLHINEDISRVGNKAEYLSKGYITSSKVSVEQDLLEAVSAVKNGDTVLLLDNEKDFIIIGTQGGNYRQISEPPNETSMNGSREGFVENVDTNISMIKRKLKDKNLVLENFIVGRRSQTKLAVVYIDDLINRDILNDLKRRINAINVDFVTASGMTEQFIEKKTYTVFPQAFSTDRPDRVAANLMDGKIAVMLDGNPSVLTVPTKIFEFFYAVEDYYSRTVASSVLRLLRYLASFISLFFPSIYLVTIKFNSELIPVEFIVPIVQSRTGISLTPFMEIVIMEIFIEFLREGGLRLPSKIAQTLSIVGGIIIGDAAVSSKMVSPTTLLVVGITVVASFLIPNYEVSLAIRVLRFGVLLFANFTGLFGITVCMIFLAIHLFSLESFGVPYMTLYKNDLKDIIVRAPLWQMNKRPEGISNKNSIRQKDFRNSFWRRKDE